MLIIKVNINSEKIDDICIQNTGECTNPLFNIWKYKIVKPEGFEDWSIYHKRDDGYLPLLAKVIEILTKHGDKNDN
jgi:hypothetical protein